MLVEGYGMTASNLTESPESLSETIAKRLRAARRASGMKQPEVANLVGQKGMTQVSLWEAGKRLPKLEDLINMARIYGVPMDFLCGLSDDPLADREENNQGFLANLISSAIQKNHLSWLNATSQSVAIAIKSQSQDRHDLGKIASRLLEVLRAYERVKELNPGFDEDIRGASNLEDALGKLKDLVSTSTDRINREIRQCEIIEREMEIADSEFATRAKSESITTVAQMMLDIGIESDIEIHRERRHAAR